MSRLISFISAAIAAVLCFAPTTQAAPITFTATGNADVTGFVTFDDSVFNGTTFQFVRNTDILALSLTVLGVSFDLGDVVTADFAIIDSSGLTPIIVNGAGFLANNGAGRVIDFRPESSALPLDGDASLEFQSDQAEPVYLGVRWLIGDATAVPEPGAVALFGAGLAGLGWLRRRRTAA